ncbi:transposase, partial [Paeniglutamicibacter antarcticus]
MSCDITVIKSLAAIKSPENTTNPRITAHHPCYRCPDPWTLLTLKRLGTRHRFLSEEIIETDAELAAIVSTHAPELLDVNGVGTTVASQLLVTLGDNPERMESEAAFAALAGVAPVPASSGKTNRHRLSRGGDRQANASLYRIVLVRMANDPRTREYVVKRTEDGLSKKEIIRCLKRYVCREIFRVMKNPRPAPLTNDLRPYGDLRQGLGELFSCRIAVNLPKSSRQEPLNSSFP